MSGRRYWVHHETTYEYGAQMLDGYSVAMLLARPTPNQVVHSTKLTCEPGVDERDERPDVFGNTVVQLGLHRPHDRLMVTATTDVTIEPPAPPRINPSWEQAAAQTAALRGVLALDVSPFLAPSRLVPLGRAGSGSGSGSGSGELRSRLVDAFASEFSPGRPVLDVIAGISSSIFYGYVFDAMSTTVSTPLEDVLEGRRGVCQDFAHLAVGVFRARGMAARYVSGYIETDPPPGETKTIGADASHAWCSVWVPEHGWIDFDPTNGIVGPDRHVTIGWGRDFADVSPIRGVVIGPSSPQSLTVGVTVTRLT